MQPFNNESTEQAAKDIAKAICDNNQGEYKRLMTLHKSMLDNMVVWEVFAFRERVHHLVKQYEAENK